MKVQPQLDPSDLETSLFGQRSPLWGGRGDDSEAKRAERERGNSTRGVAERGVEGGERGANVGFMRADFTAANLGRLGVFPPLVSSALWTLPGQKGGELLQH